MSYVPAVISIIFIKALLPSAHPAIQINIMVRLVRIVEFVIVQLYGNLPPLITILLHSNFKAHTQMLLVQRVM